MKITDIQMLPVNAGNRNLCFVRVFTDEGIIGIGEAYSAGPDLATAHTIAYLRDWLIDQNPMEIEGIWQRLYIGSRFPGGSIVNSAISGIDHALWDIKGKALGTPVYELMGGRCRQRIRVYQNPGGACPEDTAERALALREDYGFTAIKTNPLPPDFHVLTWTQILRKVESKMALLRDRLGDGMDIALDPHAKILEPARAIEMCDVLASYHPLFVEEPVRPENVDAMAAVREKARVPIATGEMLYTKWEFRDLLKVRGADIIQPDVCCCGGLTEIKKITALAEAEFVSIAPHNPMGPVATAVNAQFAATAPTFLILEYHLDVQTPRRDLVIEPYTMVDGYLELPDTPGLGIELNLECCEQHPYRPWKRGCPETLDGSQPLI